VTGKAYDQKLDALLALRNDPSSPEVVPQLRKALRDRSNYYVAKAAALVAEFVLIGLKQDLVDAFDRFLAGGAKLDPQCWAKQAIAEALAGLGHDDPAIFIKGTEHFQPEPVWGGQQDTAIRLRGICTLALVQCKLSEHELLTRLVDLLGDPEKGVRMEAIRAIGQCTSRDAVLLLRVKATAGDSEADVIGQCLTTLLEIDADEQVGYVMGFLNDSDDLRFEALAALSECRDPSAGKALIDALDRDEYYAVRDEIFQALGRCRHKQAIDFLADVIENGNTSDAAACINAIAGGPQRDEIRERIEQIVNRRGNDALAKKFHSAFQ
jgi:HEAT repeat protein